VPLVLGLLPPLVEPGDVLLDPELLPMPLLEPPLEPAPPDP
jgi:hypothetical protein